MPLSQIPASAKPLTSSSYTFQARAAPKRRCLHTGWVISCPQIHPHPSHHSAALHNTKKTCTKNLSQSSEAALQAARGWLVTERRQFLKNKSSLWRQAPTLCSLRLCTPGAQSCKLPAKLLSKAMKCSQDCTSPSALLPFLVLSPTPRRAQSSPGDGWTVMISWSSHS